MDVNADNSSIQCTEKYEDIATKQGSVLMLFV